MRISLRIADSDLGTVSNVIFEPIKQFSMKLYPLPLSEWVGEQKCSICNGKPDFLTEDMKPICKICISSLMIGLNKKQSKLEPSVPVTADVILKTRFEWSIDGEKWYSVQGRNIKPDRPDLFLEELKKSILEKRVMEFEADYEKETKRMSLFL
jgi:hypothetical protein